MTVTHELNFMVWYRIKRIEMDSNIFKSNAHRYLETRKDDVCRENSLKEGLFLLYFIPSKKKNAIYFHYKNAGAHHQGCAIIRERAR